MTTQAHNDEYMQQVEDLLDVAKSALANGAEYYSVVETVALQLGIPEELAAEYLDEDEKAS